MGLTGRQRALVHIAGQHPYRTLCELARLEGRWKAGSRARFRSMLGVSLRRAAMIKAILASLFLAPLALAAQSGVSGAVYSPNQGAASFGVNSVTQSSSLTVARAVPPPACPVGLRAQHIADGSMVNARDGKKQETAQRLHLSFSKASHPIARATVNVSGWTMESRFEQTVAKSDKHGTGQNPVAVRTLTVPVADGAADVWVPGLTGVSSIELVSLEYADGSTWTPSGADSCRFAPDPLMLIAGH